MLDILRVYQPNLRCEIETNGTRDASDALAEHVHRFVVSPKLRHSGVENSLELDRSILRAFAKRQNCVVKFVVEDVEDLEEVRDIIELTGFSPDRVWIMPQAIEPTRCLTMMQTLADPVMDVGYNLSGRMHILLWGDQRGR